MSACDTIPVLEMTASSQQHILWRNTNATPIQLPLDYVGVTALCSLFTSRLCLQSVNVEVIHYRNR